MYVQSSLEFLGKACEGYPHLRVKISIDCVEKGYATHHQVADFLGLSIERWNTFYNNFQIGDVHRVPKDLRNLVQARELRFLTGFTDNQLKMLQRALDVLAKEQLENLWWKAFFAWESKSTSQHLAVAEDTMNRIQGATD